MRRLFLVVLLLAGCGPSEFVPNAWVDATTLSVRGCAPSTSNACAVIHSLPYAQGVLTTGTLREGGRYGCSRWIRVEYPLDGQADGHGWVCARYLMEVRPTVEDVRGQVERHLAARQADALTNSTLKLAEATDPATFEAILAVGTAAATQVSWAREQVGGDGTSVLLAQTLPTGAGEDAWIERARGWAVEASGLPFAGSPVLWRRWSGPDEGGFVLMLNTSDGVLHRVGGRWSAGTGPVDVDILVDVEEKAALERALERVPAHLRRDASPAVWTGSHE